MGKKSKMKKIFRSSTTWLMVLCMVASMTGIGVLIESLYDKISVSIVQAAGESYYIYFDNGLSGYDKVEYAVDEDGDGIFSEDEYQEMYRLDSAEAADKQPTDMTNVNPAYVFVTQTKMNAGEQIVFRGTASGTVYDTMSNYQLSSASREWGYDYEDFVWTSEAYTVGADLDATNNCYFAAALAMQNKYVGADGTQFIRPSSAAEGTKDAPDVTVDLFDVLADPTSYLIETPITIQSDEIEVSTPTDTSLDSETIHTYNEEVMPFALPDGIVSDGYAMTFDLSNAEIEEDEHYINTTGPITVTVAEAASGLLKITSDEKITVTGASGTVALYYSEIENTQGRRTYVYNLTTGEYSITAENTIYGINTCYKINLKEIAFDPGISSGNKTVGADSEESFDGKGQDFTESKFFKVIGGASNMTVYSDGRINFPGTTQDYTNMDRSIEFTAESGTVVTFEAWANGSSGERYVCLTTKDRGSDSVYKSQQLPTDQSHISITWKITSNGTYYIHGIQGINISGLTVSYPDMTLRTETVTKTFNASASDTFYTLTNATTDADNIISFSGGGSTTDKNVCFTVSSTATITAEVYHTGSGTRTMRLYSSDADIDKTYSYTNGAASYTKINETNLPAGTYYLFSTGSGMKLKDLVVTYQSTIGGTKAFETTTIYPESGRNRTFTGYQYTMENGVLGTVNDVNRVGEQSVSADAEGSYATGDGKDGLSGNVYKGTATVFDYFSDWELSGKGLSEHNEINALAGSSDNGTPTQDTTFTKNTNTISYTYQGDLLNLATAQYYVEEGETDVSPLLFGSNSWFTGNGRYANENRYGGTWTDSQYGITVTAKGYSSGKTQNDTGIPYNIPAVRSYLYRFTQIFAIDNASLGMSNSRGLANVTNETETGSSISLANSAVEAPYFNADFLQGDNDANAVYGAVYDDVSFRFKKNAETGYYEYDSTQAKYATRLTQNAGNGKYYMNYTGVGVTKGDQSTSTSYQFYPFNSNAANASLANENLMFGMKLTIPLTTYTDASSRTGMFKFSGDDDVWVYLSREVTDEDGQTTTKSAIALDIGGTHGARGGVIDMKNMLAVSESSFDSDGNSIYGVDFEGKGVGNSGSAQTEEIETAIFAMVTNSEIVENGTNLSFPTQEDPAYYFGTYYYATGGTYSVSTNGEVYKVEVSADAHIYSTTTKGAAGTEITENKNDENHTTVTYPLTAYYHIYSLDNVLEEYNTDTIKYNVDVYMLERGLNSSNFKLAFKTADTTERAVKKVWTDRIQGFNNHTATVTTGVDEETGEDITEKENVKVSLYRKVPALATNVTDSDGQNPQDLEVDSTNSNIVWIYELLDEDVTLSDQTLKGETEKWYKSWDEFYDQVTVNGTAYDVEYFISAEDVTDNIEEYDTTYDVSITLSDDTQVDKRVEPKDSATYYVITEKDNQQYTVETKDLTLVPFDSEGIEDVTAIDKIMITITNTPMADLSIEKEWTLENGSIADDLTTPDPEEITVDIYRALLKKGATASASNIEKYKTVVFTPNEDADGYDGTYTVSVDGIVMGTEYAEVGERITNVIDEVRYITLKWSYLLEDNELYDENGNQYVYYAVEGDLNNHTELRPTYTPSRNSVVTADGTKVYPFYTGSSPYGSTSIFTMEIDNSLPAKPFNLEIIKVDGNDKTPLDGVVFELWVRDTSLPDIDENYVLLDTRTTENGGTINFDISEMTKDLPSYKKTYKLVEIKPLDGYYGENETISFSFNVRANGTLDPVDEYSSALESESTGDVYGGYELTPVLEDEEIVGYSLVLTLNNYRIPVELPNSGGAGTHGFIFLGSLLIMMALSVFVYLGYKKKRKVTHD